MYDIRYALLVVTAIATGTQVQGETTPGVVCEMGAIDLVFAVDTSGSVASSDFQKALNACVTLTDMLTVGPTAKNSHVGFVEFNQEATVQFYLDSYYTNAAVDSAILRVPDLGGNNDIALAMNTAITQVFNVSYWNKPERRNLPKALLIETDGQDGTDVATQQRLAAANNITVYALGVGPNVDTKQLARATGDPSRVFSINNYDGLAKAMGEICHQIATMAPPAAPHKPRECACNASELWLDLVLVLDSSNGVNSQDFNGLRALLMGFMMQLNIGQSKGQYTRVALVTVSNTAHRISNLTTYNSKTEVNQDLASIQFDGISDLNLGGGLIEAWKIIGETDERTNVHNLVILFASNGMKCKQNKASRNQVAADDDPCRVAAQMVEDPNTELMVVALKFYEDPKVPGLDFGSPCFYATNDIDLMPNLEKLACKANCFCQAPYTQFVSQTDECVEYGECVYPKGIATGYLSAQIGCQLDQTTLVDVLNADKDSFLKKIAVKVEQRPYWIGLQKTNGQYKWDSGVELNSADYTGWASGQPNATKDDCVFVDRTGQGFIQAWYSDVCDWTTPSHYYFCQKHTCDTSMYCA